MPRSLSPIEIEEFRERMRTAAEKLFAERGPDAVTMRQLASELGVSPMTAYRYFKDKDEILAVVRTNAFTRFAEALETARDGAADDAAAITAVGAAYIEFAVNNPSAYRLMFDLSQPNATEYPDLVAAGRRARSTLTAQVKNALANSGIRGDPEEVGLSMWASVHGSVMLELAGILPPGGAWRLQERAAAMFHDTLSPKA